MTAARQERKSAHRGVFFAVFSGASILAAALASIPLRAATTEWVVMNRYTGLAIDGFDPVAYFVEAAPKEGRADLEFRSDGAVWRFLNEGNRSHSRLLRRCIRHDSAATTRWRWRAAPPHRDIPRSG